MYAKILSSLFSLIMTEVRSKRRAFYPVIFTSICFKKPLLIRLMTIGKLFAEQIDTLAITPGANKVNKRWKAGERESTTEQLRMRVRA